MRKSLVLALIGLGVSGTGVGADPGVTDVTTWRWNVSQILAAQQDADRPIATVGALTPGDFNQRHERYSSLGMLETTEAGSR